MHFRKVLGLSLLVAVGLTAIGAATAQAGYKLSKGGASTSLLEVVGEVLLTELNTEGEVNLHCGGGGAGIGLGAGGGVVLGGADIHYGGCSVLGNPFCEVSSEPAAGDMELLIFGEGEVVSMTGSVTTFLIESSELSTVYFEGPFCTLPEEEVISGSLNLNVLEAETSATTHMVHIEEDELFFGENAAEFSGSAHMQDASEKAWAIELT